jgi:GntR family transcriptional regulator
MTLPFTVALKSGLPVHDQVVFAVERALVSGQLRAGDPFPSVRTLSQQLRINPNTAHRIVGTLVRDGLLEVRPGTGTLVAEPPPGTAAQRRALLNDDVEHLVVAARKLSLAADDVIDAVRDHWQRFERSRKRGAR